MKLCFDDTWRGTDDGWRGGVCMCVRGLGVVEIRGQNLNLNVSMY